MAAIHKPAERGLKGVLLLEANPAATRQGLISGGGRMQNVTHGCWESGERWLGSLPAGSKACADLFSRVCPPATRGLVCQPRPGAGGRARWAPVPAQQPFQLRGRVLESDGAARGVSRLARRGPAGRPAPGAGGDFELQIALGRPISQERGHKPTAAKPPLAAGHRRAPQRAGTATPAGPWVVAPVPSLFTLALDANPLAELKRRCHGPGGSGTCYCQAALR